MNVKDTVAATIAWGAAALVAAVFFAIVAHVAGSGLPAISWSFITFFWALISIEGGDFEVILTDEISTNS